MATLPVRTRRQRSMEYVMIVMGTVLTAVGINAFYTPNHISDGGVSGIGIILFYTLHVPVWVTLTVVNLPLIWLSHRLWGGRVGVRTIVGTLSLSFMVAVIRLPALTHNTLLAGIYGGILSGAGLGVVFRARGTTGGTDVVARFLTHVLPVSMGQAMLGIDFFVISTFGVVFTPQDAMFALIALFISSRAIDLVQEGTDFARAFTIITSQADAISQAVLHDFGRGVTWWGAHGAYTDSEKPILYIVVTRPEVSRLKELVYRMDPSAFVVVGNVHEVVGEGFRRPPMEE